MLILGTTMVGVNVSAAQMTKLFVDPPTYTASLPGEVFTIDINVSNVQDLLGFDFKLSYNTTLLDFLFATVFTFYAPIGWYTIEPHKPEGYVRFAANFTLARESNGTLAKITFNATYAGSASCTLDLYDTKLFNSTGELITHDVEDGNYKFVILIMTVATDKPIYLPGENVEVYGNLTQDGSPYQELVAIEVDDPRGYRMVARTLETGITPPGNITIIDLYPSNEWGQPKENFTRGYQAYFYCNVSNDGTMTKNVTITLNAYDNDTTPLGVTSFGPWPLTPGFCVDAVLPVLIPEWASLGNGTVYVSVFTNLPKYGGTPHCPERSATFRIKGTLLGTMKTQNAGALAIESLTENAGNYSLTFKMSPNATKGVYRVYATTLYLGISAKRNTVFGVNVIVVPDHYPTIQQAVDAATPTNNTILVMPETYNEHVTINKSLTLVGMDPVTVIINGSGTGTVVTVTANNIEISRFTIQNGGSSPNSGITLNNSSDNTIRENIVTSNKGYGIKINSSDNNLITDNTLLNNNYGIYLNHSTGTTLKGNTMTCNKYNFGVFGDSISDFNHDIDTSNTVDGKPIYYWKNQQNKQVPSNAGFIAIVSSTKIVVTDLELTKEGQGLLLAFTTDSLVERVKTLNNDYGIYLVNSDRNTIVGSQVSSNNIGVYQSYCNKNVICHNNFINNTNQVDIHQSSNTWDDSLGKGNHWSDYTGADDGSNNRTAGDGVGDTLLPHQSVDWYPLMNPWILMYDIAITAVTPALPYNATHVYPGWIVTVTITAKNEGDFTETAFNITAYYDGNLIEPEPKTVPRLTPQNETAINFMWNITGVQYGNYTLSAYATPVPGENDTADNAYTDGWVLVTIAGDADGNRRVDVLDQRLVQLAMFTMPGYPSWNPNADVDGNGLVDVTDQRKQQLNMFQSW